MQSSYMQSPRCRTNLFHQLGAIGAMGHWTLGHWAVGHWAAGHWAVGRRNVDNGLGAIGLRAGEMWVIGLGCIGLWAIDKNLKIIGWDA